MTSRENKEYTTRHEDDSENRGNTASAITIVLGSAFHWPRRQCPVADWLEHMNRRLFLASLKSPPNGTKYTVTY